MTQRVARHVVVEQIGDTQRIQDKLPRKHSVAGVLVSVTNYEEVTTLVIRAGTSASQPNRRLCPGYVIVQALKNPDFRLKANAFDIVCPDGQAVRWCLNRFYSAGLTDRACGTTSMLRLCECAAKHRVSVFLFGSTDKTLLRLATRLREMYPSLEIAGMESPPFRKLSVREDKAALERINASGAGIVFLGLGAPKQEIFAWDHRNRVNAVQLCVGAAFDFMAGTKPRAPVWMQRAGLEWLFRLVMEPKRLGRRYIQGNARFLWEVMEIETKSGFECATGNA